jgi:ketosteroid isomerase-like protein
MKKIGRVAVLLMVGALACFGQSAPSSQRQRVVSPAAPKNAAAIAPVSQLTGVYRIDLERSDKLYSVVAGATSKLPFGEQQKFFLDLTVRLTPPDLIAIERRGRRVSLASSRAPRITFEADGLTHSERGGDGQIVNTRATLRAEQLTVSVSGQSDDKFNVTFEPLEGGRALRVTRRLNNEQLNQPIVILSVYEKISDVAEWSVYGEPLTSDRTLAASARDASTPVKDATGDAAFFLRRALEEWIAATNARDIQKQMSFYPPVLKAFYLTRNVPRAAVRAEKIRVFQKARTIDVRAESPELIFQEAGQSAVMRFRKRYVIAGGAQDRSGEVVQELRWRQTPEGWKIFSERDVRVIR